MTFLEELRSIFNAAVDGIAYVDASGKIISANKRLVEELLGYELDETIGANFASQGRIDPEYLPRVLEAMKEVLATGKPIRNLEVRLIRKDGRKILTEVSTGVIKKEGKIIGLIAMVRDITERKRMEKEEKKRTAELEKFSKMAVGRELKMVELKKEIKKLKEKLKMYETKPA